MIVKISFEVVINESYDESNNPSNDKINVFKNTNINKIVSIYFNVIKFLTIFLNTYILP